MISAWIPKKPYCVITQSGRRRRVFFVDNRGNYPKNMVGIDQYYDSNHAVFTLIPKTALETMPGYNEGVESDKATDLYNKVFGLK